MFSSLQTSSRPPVYRRAFKQTLRPTLEKVPASRSVHDAVRQSTRPESDRAAAAIARAGAVAGQRSRGTHRLNGVLLGILRQLQSLRKFEESPFFKGVYAPVSKEVSQSDLEVIGRIPPDLNGVYVRTGPNPQHEPHGGYTMVDGEGMLHAVSFSEGQAVKYCNHWLRCARFNDEREAGSNLYLRIGDLAGVAGLAILVLTRLFPAMFPEPDEYVNYQLGNTSITFHDQRVLAMMEGGFPFHTKIDPAGEVSSVGPYSYGGELETAMTGHPKVDPLTGELLSFFYKMVSTGPDDPHCTFSVTSPEGELSPAYPVDISRGQMMHDFAITQRYAVFLDAAIAFSPLNMLKRPLDGMPLEQDTTTPCRIGLLRRDDPTAPVMWFEFPPFAFFHTANAWEDGDWVHVILCRFTDIDMEAGLIHGFSGCKPEVCRFSVNTASGETAETLLVPGLSTDFPVVPPQLIGRPHRFCYCSVAGHTASGGQHNMTTSLIKVDMTADEGRGLVARIEFGPGVAGGEATFVPRDADALLQRRCDEDDGYLIVYTTDSLTMTSFCVIYDANTMSETPLAKVILPQRVPSGLHGSFIPFSSLATQR